jgi:hypothetical protein
VALVGSGPKATVASQHGGEAATTRLGEGSRAPRHPVAMSLWHGARRSVEKVAAGPMEKAIVGRSGGEAGGRRG